MRGFLLTAAFCFGGGAAAQPAHGDALKHNSKHYGNGQASSRYISQEQQQGSAPAPAAAQAAAAAPSKHTRSPGTASAQPMALHSSVHQEEVRGGDGRVVVGDTW